LIALLVKFVRDIRLFYKSAKNHRSEDIRNLAKSWEEEDETTGDPSNDGMLRSYKTAVIASLIY
jgi:hypothetical protein